MVVATSLALLAPQSAAAPERINKAPKLPTLPTPSSAESGWPSRDPSLRSARP